MWGLAVDFNRWVGVNFDYRRFIVDFNEDVAGKNRYTFGVSFGLR